MSDESKVDPYATSDKPSPGGVSTSTYYPDEEAGTMIGPYKLLQQLGKGGMGVVWMAEQTEPVQRRVALKIIKAGLGGDQVLARFEAERQALAMMDHPNIAKVLDAGATSAGRPYFVMELVKGIPFTKYCDQEHLTPKERLELFIPVCNAVQHAHQKGIIHRDLKPSNVLIALYDGKPVPKVIDFGIAKAMHQKLTERTMFTEVGQIVGTLEYMAPEQAELNNLDIDTRADIYSLGVMLYELLTGAPPFPAELLRAEAYLEMLRMIREVEPPKPSTKLSKSEELPAIAAKRKLEPKKLTGMVQGDLDWIVMKCLEKDRGRRYETANQLGQELQRFLADDPVQAGPPSVGYRARKFLRRNKGPVVAAILVVLALVGGIIGTSVGLVEADKATEKALKSAENERKAAAAEKHATQSALNVARENKRLAEEADERREQVETMSLRIQFEKYNSMAEDSPGLALVGMATLLPKAVRLKNQSLADSVRLQIGGQYTALAVALKTDIETPSIGGADFKGQNEAANFRFLQTPIESYPMREMVPFNLALGNLIAKGRSWGDRETAFLIDKDSFVDDIWAKEVSPPRLPARMAMHNALQVLLAQVGRGKAVYVVRKNFVEITTYERLNKEKKIWSPSKKIGAPPGAKERRAVPLALSGDGKVALIGGWDNTARLWDTATGKPIGPPLQHKNWVNAVALSADGKTALTGSTDNTARLWDPATGEPVWPPLKHVSKVFDVALSTDGKTAFTRTQEGTRLWDTTNGEPLEPPFKAGISIMGGMQIFVSSDEKDRRLRDARTGKPFGLLRVPGYRVALSANGNVAITLGGGGARLWETAVGKPTGPPLQHQYVSTVALSANGKVALTGGLDGIARLWDTATGKQIGPPLQHQNTVENAALNADGTTALTGSDGETPRLWKVPQPIYGDPERIMLWAETITGMGVNELAEAYPLGADDLDQRRKRLKELGGPPEY